MEYAKDRNEYADIVSGTDYFHEYLCCMMAALMQSKPFNALTYQTLKSFNERAEVIKQIQTANNNNVAGRKRPRYEYTSQEETGPDRQPKIEQKRFPRLQEFAPRQQIPTNKKAKADRKSANGPYICHDCGKILKRSSSLSNHRLIHKNIKAFKCEKCDASFLRKSDLGKHYAIHTGSKPYVCNICNKSFSQSSNMLTHKRRHSGVKPYKCEFCSKSFYRKVDVKRHEIVHTVPIRE